MVTVRGSEAHHALRVMRLGMNDVCEVFDGRGKAAVGKIVGAAGDALEVEMLEVKAALAARTGITLAVAVPKGGTMDWIVQKAVELGVERIVPVVSERTIVRVDAAGAAGKAVKWSRTAVEACKQCGVYKVPVVEVPRELEAVLTGSELPELRVVCALTEGALPVRTVLEAARARGVKEAALLVGPEGDFTEQEYGRAVECGFVPVSLGPVVLRVESAAVAAVAMVRYALDPVAGGDALPCCVQ